MNPLSKALLSLPDPVFRLLFGKPEERDGQTLDKSAQLIVKLMRAWPSIGLDGTRTAEEARRAMGRAPKLPGWRREWAVPTEEVTLPSEGGGLRALLFRPPGAEGGPVIVFFHGGGFVLGTPEEHALPCHQLAKLTGYTVVSVDYRLAPEHPFPAAPHDARDAVLAVHTLADALRVDASRLAVCGDSAGGTLSLAASLQLRGTPHAPTAQALIYPTTDAVDECPSRATFAEGYLLTNQGIRWFRDNYLPNEADREHILASPIRGHDLSGLPPSLLVVAGFDPIRDESTLLQEALVAHGNAVERFDYPGQFHGFFVVGDVVPEGLEAVERTAAWLVERLGG